MRTHERRLMRSSPKGFYSFGRFGGSHNPGMAPTSMTSAVENILLGKDRRGMLIKVDLGGEAENTRTP
jgi:hypothetical protein